MIPQAMHHPDPSPGLPQAPSQLAAPMPTPPALSVLQVLLDSLLFLLCSRSHLPSHLYPPIIRYAGIF